MPIPTFPIIRLWKLLSCHSNETTWARIIKNTIYVETNVMNMYAKFQLLMLMRRRFLNNFSKIYSFCCHGNQSNSVIWTEFIWIVEDYSRNISVKKILIICSEVAKIATFHFSHYKSMETISCHSNQFLSDWNKKERFSFTASEVIWKCWRTTDEGWLPIL